MNYQQKKTIGALLLFLMLSLKSYGQQDSTTTHENIFDLSLEELLNIDVTTASRKSESISEAPATIIVLTQQDIVDRGYANLKDIFQDLPGMETIDNYFSEYGTLVPVRGLEGNQKIIVLLNGMRTNPAGGEFYQLRADFSIRKIKQIEVIYGPGSTLYGQDAISAVINVITDDKSEKTEVDAQFIGGSNSHFELMTSITSPIKKDNEITGSISAIVQFQKANLDDFTNTRSDWQESINDVGGNAEMNRWDNGMSAMLRIVNKNSSIQFWHKESSRSSSEGGYTGVLYYQDEAIWHDRTTAIEAKNTLDIGEKSNLESSIMVNRYEIDEETQYVFPIGASTFSNSDFKYGVGTRIQVEEKFSHEFSEKLSFMSGIMLANMDIVPKSTIPGGADPNLDLASQAGTWDYVVPGVDTISIPKVHNIVFQQLGGYGELHFKPIDKLKIITGVRVDATTLYSDVPVSPRLSAIYKFNENLTAKYIYTQAYVSPAPYFGYASYFNGATVNTINPSLKPERANSNEVNITYSKNDVYISGSGYFNHQKDIVQPGDFATAANVIYDTVLFDGNPVTLTQAANLGERITYGVDVYARYKIGKASFWTSYSYVNGETNLDGQIKELQKVSNHNIRFGSTVRVNKKLSATITVRYGSTPIGLLDLYDNGTETASIINSEVKNPYQVNAHINYMLTDKIRAFVNIKNLTNNKFSAQGILAPTPQEIIKVMGGLALSY